MIHTLVFISNYINHHQKPLALAFYSRLKDGYCFIQTEPMEEERIQMGWDQSAGQLPFVRNAYEEKENCSKLIDEADVVICDYMDDITMIQNRLNHNQLTFWLSERIYREGQWRAITPKGLLRKYQCFTKYRNSEFYLLSVGAFVASDYHIVHAFPNKVLRWGYFPEMKDYQSGYPEQYKSSVNEPVRILYAGRFLSLKHPEYALETLKCLKENGYNATLEMIGGGEEEQNLIHLIQQYELDHDVKMLPFLKPEEVRSHMEQADIYLFPSNHLEGWGAVINEAMNSGCAVVAGHLAGGAPFLIQNGVNGMLFQSENSLDCYRKVEILVKDRQTCRNIGMAATKTIQELWNAETAAGRFLDFCVQQLENQMTVNGKKLNRCGNLQDCIQQKDGPMSIDVMNKPKRKYR